MTSNTPGPDNPYAKRSAWGRPAQTPFAITAVPKVQPQPAPPPRPSTILIGAPALAASGRPALRPAPPPPSTPPPSAAPMPQARTPEPERPAPAAPIAPPDLGPVVSPVLASRPAKARSWTPLLIGGGVVGAVGVLAALVLILNRPATPAATAPAVAAVAAVTSPALTPSLLPVAPPAAEPTPAPVQTAEVMPKAVVARAEPRTAAVAPAPVVEAPPATIAVEPAPLVVPPPVRAPVLPPPVPAARPSTDPDAAQSTRLPDGT